MNFGRLGRVFGRLGAQVKAPAAGGGGGPGGVGSPIGLLLTLTKSS